MRESGRYRNLTTSVLGTALVATLGMLDASIALAGANNGNASSSEGMYIEEVWVGLAEPPGEGGGCADLSAVAHLVIAGGNFLAGREPVVLLGTQGALEVCRAIDTEIIALLPSGLPSGDYRLEIITGRGVPHYDSHDLTIGAVGLQGPTGATGPEGSQGATGAQGTTGPQGPTGSQGATGPQGATAPEGPQGKTGAVGSQGVTGVQGEPGATGNHGLT